MQRRSGILLHISSLPSAYGIGDLGPEACRFADFLRAAGQTCWQILPISPTGYGDSPYQSFSAFAGNPYFISPDSLIEDGLLTDEEAAAHRLPPGRVDYGRLYETRFSLLRRAFSRFQSRRPADFDSFCAQNAHWLPDYALFMALKDRFGGAPWLSWDADLRLRRPAALKRAQAQLRQETEFYCFCQYVFGLQWQRLRDYVNSLGIRILGDIPIYVPLDSCDVWAHPELFQLNRLRRPRVVAGCPPDAFTADGQYWGNPIYDWERMKQDGYGWWLQRIGAAGARFDALRIDHFRGFESYWAIPAHHKTARHGAWVKGPGRDFIRTVQAAFPALSFVAEDLGFLTPAVHKLVRDSGWPGMKVLQFAFDPDTPSLYLPRRYRENCICYTGTHDNETLCQWCGGLSARQEAYTRRYLGIGPEEDLPLALLRAGAQSNAFLFVSQLQDWLRLGPEGRMNEPGHLKPENWCWRMRPEDASDALAAQIRELTIAAHRV